LLQIEQLQDITWARSVSTSKRTRPQWQPPLHIFVSTIARSSQPL
jgi:hypothetical protein